MENSREMALTVKADLGASYLTKLAGWLVSPLTAPEPHGLGLIRHVSIETGTGSFENVKAVQSGEAAMACVGPMSAAEMAVAGKGYFKEAGPDDSLCAVVRVPHPDAVLLAVKADSGRKSYTDIFDPKETTVVVSTPHNTQFFTSVLFEQILAHYGNTYESWCEKGGRLIECYTQDDACNAMMRGQADAIFADNNCIHEWWNLKAAMDLRLIGLDEPLAERLTDYGFAVREIEGTDPAEQITAVDSSDWIVICKKDFFPKGVACILERGIRNTGAFAAPFPFNYATYPAREQPIPLPVKQEDLVQTGMVPLHDAAAAVCKKYHII